MNLITVVICVILAVATVSAASLRIDAIQKNQPKAFTKTDETSNSISNSIETERQNNVETLKNKVQNKGSDRILKMSRSVCLRRLFKRCTHDLQCGCYFKCLIIPNGNGRCIPKIY